jgi:predicted PurR-regulated permease PerM
MSRRTVSLLILALSIAAVALIAPDVALIVFAGILLAILIHGSGHWIADKLGIRDGFGIALFLLIVVGALATFFMAIAPAVGEQIDELARRLPDAVDALRQRVEEYYWGDRLLQRLRPEGLISAESGAAAASAVTTTFGALGSFVIIVFIGLYGAFDPLVYRRGLRVLLAPTLRQRGEDVMDAAVDTLRNWLAAQLMSMAVVGVLTSLGLWVAGVPLAFALGLIAGLLAFIPNIGPIIAIAPALLLSFPDGLSMIVIVLGIYLGVQTLESYVVTPLIQQEKVSMPPALVIAVQLLFGVLFGILGLALATPIAAVCMTLTREVYVSDYLEREGARSPTRDTFRDC